MGSAAARSTEKEGVRRIETVV
eukprot:COSAG01_NODE_55255_length_326_cov_0.951542_1_plen_21_part_10